MNSKGKWRIGNWELKIENGELGIENYDMLFC